MTLSYSGIVDHLVHFPPVVFQEAFTWSKYTLVKGRASRDRSTWSAWSAWEPPGADHLIGLAIYRPLVLRYLVGILTIMLLSIYSEEGLF